MASGKTVTYSASKNEIKYTGDARYLNCYFTIIHLSWQVLTNKVPIFCEVVKKRMAVTLT